MDGDDYRLPFVITVRMTISLLQFYNVNYYYTERIVAALFGRRRERY